MNTPDKCPHCGAEQEIPFNVYGYKCGTSCDGQVQSDLCKEWVLRIAVEVELAATKRELEEAQDALDLMRDEFQRIRARIVEKGCDETKLGNDVLELCTRAMSGITQRISVIAQRDVAEARVRELEGLAIGNQESGDGGLWVEVFIPIERLGGANCEGEECPTLGDAMPRKEEA